MPRRESRVVLWARRAMIAIACIHAVFFCWSIYRRIWQVQRIEVRATSTVLVPESAVGYDVITSGEVPNLIRLELVQGAQREILLERRARVNSVSVYDPRIFRYSPMVTIRPELLALFRTGPATLRVTAFGGMKLLRTPAPRIRELQVRLETRPGSNASVDHRVAATSVTSRRKSVPQFLIMLIAVRRHHRQTGTP